MACETFPGRRQTFLIFAMKIRVIEDIDKSANETIESKLSRKGSEDKVNVEERRIEEKIE